MLYCLKYEMNTNKNPGSIFGKLDKAGEGKQRKEVQECQPSAELVFMEVCLSSLCCVLCICVYEFV